jgi:hypothetical protein
MAHRSENVNNVEAHVNGPKKEHDGNHGKDYGKDHSEQTREGAHQSRSATPGMQTQTVQALSSRELREEDRYPDSGTGEAHPSILSCNTRTV